MHAIHDDIPSHGQMACVLCTQESARPPAYGIVRPVRPHMGARSGLFEVSPVGCGDKLARDNMRPIIHWAKRASPP
jgi:hypothetical protein